MRVSMLYNEDAGRQVRLDHIRQVMAEHGHQLVCVIDEKAGVERLLEGRRPDVVVAAGGDGTVACVARMLARTGIPLAILPLGTANNIAGSVGTSADIDHVIAGWATARRVPLDLGVAHGAWGRRLFVEGVGGGLIPAAIADARKRLDRDDHLPAHAEVAEAVATFSEVLARLEPTEWTIVIDGMRTTSRFLLVEVLNLGWIGPNLVLSPDANPSDGLFRVVMAAEEHREELARYLGNLNKGHEDPPWLISEAARQVTLEGATEVHVDDKIFSADGRTVSMHVEAGALELLI